MIAIAIAIGLPLDCRWIATGNLPDNSGTTSQPGGQAVKLVRPLAGPPACASASASSRRAGRSAARRRQRASLRAASPDCAGGRADKRADASVAQPDMNTMLDVETVYGLKGCKP